MMALAFEDERKYAPQPPPFAVAMRFALAVWQAEFRTLFCADFTHQRMEGVINVGAKRGGCLVERAAELTRERFTLVGCDLALHLQVELIADEYKWRVFRGAYLLDQFAIFERFLETVAVGDAVANEETFAAAHVLVSHGSEFHLSSCV